MHPDFIIIGAMKCATSTLHEQLARQTNFFMSSPKEPNFFSDDENFERGLQWYRSCFQKPSDEGPCWVGESSTHYTKLPTYPHTVARLAEHLPDVRLIYVMRQPIDRLVSQYIHEWSMGNIRCDLDRAIDQHPELIAYSQYARQLAPYLEAFGSCHILPLFFERVRAFPQVEMLRIGRFLECPMDLRWDHELTPQNVSRDRMRKSPTRDALTRVPLAKGLLKTVLPTGVRERIKDRWRLSKRPQPSDENLARLRTLFDEDLRQLSDWLGASLNCDTFVDRVIESPIGFEHNTVTS